MWDSVLSGVGERANQKAQGQGDKTMTSVSVCVTRTLIVLDGHQSKVAKCCIVLSKCLLRLVKCLIFLRCFLEFLDENLLGFLVTSIFQKFVLDFFRFYSTSSL